jgi:trans-2,3-dihydro-3-hydroxyanthranilate isomerase
MGYKFHIVDVFSASSYGGNQLAVLPDAVGLSSEAMQMIAREFNFAETTFILPSTDRSNTCRVRIFTPKAEVDFAGHPTIGTACALVMRSHFEKGRLVLEENVGPVIVDVEQNDEGVYRGTLTLAGKIDAPEGAPSNADLAAVLSLNPPEVRQVFFAGVGLPFCFVELGSRAAVDRAAIDRSAWDAKLARAWSPNVFFFAGTLENGGELYARMSAPALGIEEDPATGSACAALVGAMASKPDFQGVTYRLSVKQGVAMGRRSDIEASAKKANQVVMSVSVSGAVAYVASGNIEAPGPIPLA